MTAVAPDVPRAAPAIRSQESHLAKTGRMKSSKTEILRISRGRLKDDQPSANQLDNKRKRNSSRENSLESLLEEEDGTSEDCASGESLGC